MKIAEDELVEILDLASHMTRKNLEEASLKSEPLCLRRMKDNKVPPLMHVRIGTTDFFLYSA